MENNSSEPSEFQIDDIYSVPGKLKLSNYNNLKIFFRVKIRLKGSREFIHYKKKNFQLKFDYNSILLSWNPTSKLDLKNFQIDP